VKLKEKDYQFSSAPTKVFEKILKDYGITLGTPKWEIKNVKKAPVQFFRWERSKEDSQWVNYLDHLKVIFQWPQGYELENVASSNLLNNTLSGKELNGSTDVILLDVTNWRGKTFKNHIRVAIELKKSFESKLKQSENQAVLEHLSASELNRRQSVITVLTDLNDNWYFWYFGKSGVLWRITANQVDARFLLENVFNQNGLENKYFPEGFVNRLSWHEFIQGSMQFSENVSNASSHNDGDNDNHSNAKDSHDSSDRPRTKQFRPTLSHAKAGNDAGTHEKSGYSGTGTMLKYGCDDIANEMDLLEFMDDDDEGRIAILQNFMNKHIASRCFYDIDAFIQKKGAINPDGELTKGICTNTESKINGTKEIGE
jgi:hypothetical protein